MATFLIKTNCEVYLNGAEPRPTAAAQWEGASVTTRPPKRLGSGEAKQIQPGDALIIWTHEDQHFGNGHGLTAIADVGEVFVKGENCDVVMVNVRLIKPHIRLNEQSDTPSGSRLLDFLMSHRLRRTVEVDADVVSEFWEVVESIQRRKRELIESYSKSLLHSAERQALEADGQKIAVEYDRRFAEVEMRPGQGIFRGALVKVYGTRCVVTGSRVLAVLEAAHIVPFSQDIALRNNVRNGLLLRADIHALFDRFLFSINPEGSRIVIANDLRGTAYERLENKLVKHKANHELLRRQFEEFERRSR